MSDPGNRYCEVLGIAPPRVESIVTHREANFFGMFVVALLEHGSGMTLVRVAERLAQAGVGPEQVVLASLKRCKPARPPVYRSGELYELDPHDHETDMWVFRLGLRPRKVHPIVTEPVVESRVVPADDVPLSREELADVMKTFRPSGWSDLRVAICVLDVHGGRMATPDFLNVLVACDASWRVFAQTAQHWHRAHAVRIERDGSLALDRSNPQLQASRRALRKRITELDQRKHPVFDPRKYQVEVAIREAELDAEGARLERQPRVIVHAFPASAPRALVLLDVNERRILTFGESERERVRVALSAYDAIAGLDVRDLMRALEFDAADRRLGELRPTSKRIRVSGSRRRSVAVTPELALRGSCGLRKSLASASTLKRSAARRDPASLRAHLIEDAKLLFALYAYGRLHHHVHLAAGRELESVPAPWVHCDEPSLWSLMRKAVQMQQPLEVVVGQFPDWDTPDARAELAWPIRRPGEFAMRLHDSHDDEIPEYQVQTAKLADPAKWSRR